MSSGDSNWGPIPILPPETGTGHSWRTVHGHGREVPVALTDDLDGSDADETILLAPDGTD